MNPNGTIVPNSGYPFNGLIRAGNEIPDDQIGRVNLIGGGDYDRIPTGAPRGLYNGEHLLMPRLSFAWSPTSDGRTAVRGGVGLFYDRPEGNLVFPSLNLPPFIRLSQYQNGNLSNPSGGTPAALAPIGEIHVIDPNLGTAHNLNYSISVQRELGRGYFFEAAYVGNRGRDLIWFPDINHPSHEEVHENSELPPAEQVATNSLRPYKGYSDIHQRRGGAESNYHGLQLYATKRQGDLSFTASYTLSRVLTNASSFGEEPEETTWTTTMGRRRPIAGTSSSRRIRIACRFSKAAADCSRRRSAGGKSAASRGCSPADTSRPWPTPRRAAGVRITSAARWRSQTRTRRCGSIPRRSLRRRRIVQEPLRSESSRAPDGIPGMRRSGRSSGSHRTGQSAFRRTCSTCSTGST